jgi:hypothetical protein
MTKEFIKSIEVGGETNDFIVRVGYDEENDFWNEVLIRNRDQNTTNASIIITSSASHKSFENAKEDAFEWLRKFFSAAGQELYSFNGLSEI